LSCDLEEVSIMSKGLSREAEFQDVEDLFEPLGPGPMFDSVGQEISDLVPGPQAQDETPAG
jgi:hypothetical protein